MKNLRILLLSCIAGLSLVTEAAQAGNENIFLEQIQPPLEQAVGQSQSALWTLSDVATQYQPSQPTQAMQDAMRAQQEGRFLDALILLDDAGKSRQVGDDAEAEMNLLRSSFLLQGHQPQQALEILAPLLGKTRHAADAHALTAMAHLQQGQMREALEAAKQAHDLRDDMLPHLALSYALQGAGRLAEASVVMHDFNAQASKTGTPQAVALAREAELALTLGQAQAAGALVNQAEAADAAHPYVVAVSGLAHLIDGKTKEAKADFETALKRDPRDAKALLGLGLAEIKLGNHKAGQQKLQDANEAAPGNALILTYLGRAQQQNDQTAAAMESWRSARQADPKDPTPWLYQAQAELQANRLQAARESLREAQARTAYRQVYRGENLLREDEQLLQANLAEIQRRLGMESIAFHTLSDSVGEKNAANLRNQADLLQGRRFGESARRSLLLQSLFTERPGNLPAALDVYGDGAGLTGAQIPQHGAVSVLSAQQASYNNYDELFNRRTVLEADAVAGSKNTSGGQIRLGAGNDMLGLGIALRQYKSDGAGQPPSLLNNPNSLDNRIGQGIVQWRPDQFTQVFVSHQTFRSLHGEIQYPWDPINMGTYHQIEDDSSIARLGLRHSLSDSSELRGLISRQQTGQTDNNEYLSYLPPYSYLGFGTLPFPGSTQYASSSTHSAELEYRMSGADSATQWGASLYHGPYVYGAFDLTSNRKQVYAARQQMLSPHWRLDAHLVRENLEVRDNISSAIYTSLQRWLPQLGLLYTPDEATHVRLAAWRDISGDTVGDATLAPATLGGIVMKRPGERNMLVGSVVLQADRQLDASWLLDGQIQRRFADYIPQGAPTTRKQTDESRLALHWQPSNYPWIVGVSCDYEYVHVPGPFDNFTYPSASDSVEEQRLRSQQLDVRWFAGAQWTVHLAWSHNIVSATMQSSDMAFNPILVPYRESFNQVDASLDWRFNKTGSLNLGVRNASDKPFQYTSLDPLNPRFSNARLVYARIKWAW